MRIGILGSGEVGRVLGSGLVALGHQVMMGTRNPKKPEVQTWIRENGSSACAGSFAEAARFGDLIFFCIRWAGTENAIALAGASSFAGKVVVDVTNPLDFSTGGPPQMQVDPGTSAGELMQQWLPSSKVIKALNAVSARFMADGRLGNENLDMFIAGNDDGAKQVVSEILTAWHWTVHDLGGIDRSKLLESFALLSILLGYHTKRWDHVFKVLYRK